jgi:hypothetical protein
MSSPAEFHARHVGSAALAALRAGPATVFASFERSCYVETPSGIACLGGPGLGMGPLNAIVEDFESLPVGIAVFIAIDKARLWRPCASSSTGNVPEIQIPESIRGPAQRFLDWISGSGKPDNSLIGLGPGLTPAGDDFVGGAMIALRVCGTTAGDAPLADRIAGWALPLARERTNRISRAHLECAARGEGHEALHDLLCSFEKKHLERLARVGHTSGLDAAAGALLALTAVQSGKLAPV